MPSVAIVGAGPAGLVAAKKLLQAGQFTVTIFERGPAVGGLWSELGLIDPEMRTNLSQFTVSFSDLAWDSVPLQSGKPAPMYPKARQVREYLEHYFQEFIPKDAVRFNTEVLNVERVPAEPSRDQPNRWRLFTQSTDKRVNGVTQNDEGDIFDYLVVSPGFFSHPLSLNNILAADLTQTPSSATAPRILHSSEYHVLSDLFPNGAPAGGTAKAKVLVVGGSHSGSDVASSIALHSSSSKYFPGVHQDHQTGPVDCEIIHLTSHDMFAIPAFLRNSDSKTCAFQPLDFVLYNRSSRPPDPPPDFTFALLNPERIKAGRKLIRTLLEGADAAAETGKATDAPPYAVVSETYGQFVSAGHIKPLIGSLKLLENGTGPGLLRATVSGETEFHVEDIAAVVFATGFNAANSFSFLSPEILADLGYDKSCQRVPLVLSDGYLSQNTAVPELAVIGFPGSYWGILEMQARAAVRNWGDDPLSTKEPKKAESEKIAAYFQELRTAIRDADTVALGQNPFGDYVGLMEQASRELHLRRMDLSWEQTKGLICPARYVDPVGGKCQPVKTISKMQEVQQDSQTSGLFLARAVFHGWLGKWNATSDSASEEQCTLELNFHPRLPTSSNADFEYLCVENLGGEEIRKVYRYDESADQITIWSVNESDNLSAQDIISRLDFSQSSLEGDTDTAVAHNVAAKADDGGESVLRFYFKGALLKSFSIETQTGRRELLTRVS